MNIFDMCIEEGINSTNNTEITLEDYIELMEASMCNILEDEEIDPDMITEGANIDITKEFVSMRKDLREKSKSARKALSKKDYTTAKKKLDEMYKIIDDGEKAIRAIPAGRIDNILCGYVGAFLLDSIEIIFPVIYFIDATMHGVENDTRPGIDGSITFASLFNYLAKKVGKKAIAPQGAFEIVQLIITIYRNAKTFFEELDNKDNESGDAWNSYRNRIIRFLNEYKAAIKKTQREIDKIKNAKAK